MANFTVVNLNDAGAGSLRQAILDAEQTAAADVITFSGALSGGTIRLTSGELVITQDLVIDGDINNDGTPDVTISGDVLGNDVTTQDANGTTITNALSNKSNDNDNSRVFSINGGANGAGTTLEGLTVTGGVTLDNFDGSGGINVGINGQLTVLNSSISGNYSRDNGGGIYNRRSTSVIDSIISGNYAGDRGGGIYSQFSNSYFDVTLTVSNSTISGNETGTSFSDIGGGISNAGTATITNSAISGNTSRDGGGIHNSGILDLTNVTLANNTATVEGGGLFNNDVATLTNTTVSGNDAGTNGDGILTDDAGDTTTLINSIVLGNLGTETAGVGTLNATASITAGVAGDVFENIGAGGGGLLANNGGEVETIALKDQDSNPALDISNNLPFGVLTDATGQARAVDRAGLDNGGFIDAGAFELQSGTVVSIAPSLIVTTTLDVVDLFDGETSLREAIQLANFNNDGSTVTFAADVGDAFEFGGTINLALGELELSSTLTIGGDLNNDGAPDIIVSGDANGDDTPTTDRDGAAITDVANNLNTADNSRVFHVTGGNSTIEGLTVTGGIANDGGGIYVDDGAELTVRNGSISGNATVDAGGGIYNNGTISIIGSLVSANTANDDGGGFYNAGYATITRSTIADNFTATDGAGIRNNYFGTLTVNTSTISDNATSGGTFDSGGGIYNTGTTSIFGSTISNNTGDEGGGIYNDGSLTLTNTTVSGNNALSLGDGVYTGNGETTTLIASIVLGNQGTETAGYGTVTSTLSVTAGAAADVFATIDGTTGGGVLANNGGNLETIALKDDDSNPALDVTNLLPVGVATDAADQPRGVDRAGVDNGGFVDAGAFEIQNGTAQSIDAPSLVVTTTSDVANAFDGETTLREAVELANQNADASIITFASGAGETFEFGGTITLTQGQLDLVGTVTIDGDVTNDGTPDVTITGDAAGDDTTTFDLNGTTITDGVTNLNEADNSRVFSIDDENANVTLEGLTITGGVTTGNGDGAGIFVSYGAGNLAVVNSSVSGNSSSDKGGGIYNGGTTDIIGSHVLFNNNGNNGGIFNADYAVLSLTNSLVAGNDGGNGAGIYNGEDAFLKLTNSTIFSNTGNFGAGIYNDTGGDVTLINSTIADNSGSVGGGLFNRGVSTLTGSTVSGNAGTDGGGIYNAFQRTLILSNVTIANNTASGTGGGIYSNGQAHLTNTTVSGNDAVGGGDGIYTVGGAGKVTTLVNSIVLGNQGTETAGAGTLTNISSIIIGSPADVFAAIDGATGGGLLADNAGPVQTLALKNDVANPALNTGDNNQLQESVANRDFNRDGDQVDTLIVDASGQTRIQSGTVDLGAIEVGASILTGTPGIDVIPATILNDVIDGLAGNDTVDFSTATSGVTVNLNITVAQNTGGSGIDTIANIENISGSSSADRFIGKTGAAGGNNVLSGQGDNDQLFGIGGDDILNGGVDNDLAFGGNGSDQLNGDEGDDILKGGNGNDLLTGGIGRDLLFGQAGADTFVFNDIDDTGLVYADRDIIRDFSQTEGDLIDLSGIDAVTGGGDDAFTFLGTFPSTILAIPFTNVAGQLFAVNTVGGQTVVWGDVDGDGVQDFTFVLDGALALTGGDFIL